MTINLFLDKFKEVDKAIKDTGKEIFFEALNQVKTDELFKLGIENEFEVEPEILNETIKKSDLLRFIYAINMNISDDKKYIIFKYNVRRAKLFPLYTYARGLVVDRETYQVVSQTFEKFFNVGEKGIGTQEINEKLEKQGIGYAVNKLDGSNVGIRHLNGKNLVHTMGSLTKKEQIFEGKKMLNHIVEAEQMITPNIQKALEENADCTFIFESIGETTIVVEYPKEYEGLHLIGIRQFGNNNESSLLSQRQVREYATKYNLPCEPFYEVKNMNDIEELLKQEQFKGQEGVVVYIGDEIFKVKKEEYVCMHHLKLHKPLTDIESIKEVANLIVPLVMTESIDDYIGIFKGDIPKKMQEIIDVTEILYGRFYDQVIEKINHLKDMDDKEFFDLVKEGHFPNEYKGFVGAIRKGKWKTPNPKLVRIIADKVVKIVPPIEILDEVK